MKQNLIIVGLVGLSLSGCATSGIKFAESKVPENQVLPPTVTNSIPASIYRHDLNTLTGQIAVIDSLGNLTPVLRAVDAQKLPTITAITEEQGLLYRSIISSEGNSILNAATSNIQLSSTQRAELLIKQTTLSALQEIPRDVVLSQASKITPGGGKKLVYITGAVLYLVKTTLLDEVNKDATVEYGPVFGINGKVYKSSSSIRNDYVITVNTVDVSVLKNPETKTVETLNSAAKVLTDPAPTAPKPPAVVVSSEPIPQSAPAQATAVSAPVLPPPEPVNTSDTRLTIEVSK